MQILKAFFKIANNLKGNMIMYVAIFITVGVIITSTATDETASFAQDRLNVAVFDEDGTPESRALYDYIAKNHEIVEMEKDPEKLWDDLYYRTINYVLTIEKGYSEKLKNGDTENLLTYSVDPQSYSGEYLNLQLRQYVSTLGMYLISGRDFDTAQADTVKTLENDTKVTAQDFSGGLTSGVNYKFTVFMRFLAYVIPAIMITMLSRIIIELRTENIKNRTFCSPIKPLKYNGQIIAGSMAFSVGIWIFAVFIALIFGGFPAFTENILLAIFNSFVFMLVSVGIGVLISMCMSGNSFIIDMLSNIICLGMAFLCGVFVGQSLLGEGVLKVARFLPAYWYVCATDDLGQVGGAVYDPGFVWQCIGIEALFAAALFAVALVVARFKKT